MPLTGIFVAGYVDSHLSSPDIVGAGTANYVVRLPGRTVRSGPGMNIIATLESEK